MKLELAELLKGVEGKKINTLIGFDGFVDEVVHVVDKRYGPNPGDFERVLTIEAYAKRLVAGAGLSTNVEIVPLTRKLGGNGPIYALGLKKYGINLTYIGCTGVEALNPVFHEMAEDSVVIGIAEPGQTDAMEFDDGKIIRSKLASLNSANWESIASKIGVDGLAQMMDDAELISFNNWALLNQMSDIWKHILADVIPKMKADASKKTMFFDLCDPEKRLNEEILEAMELIQRFKAAGFRVALGLNRKETCEIAEITGKEIPDYKAIPLRELTEYLADYLKLDCLVVHPTECAACVADGKYYEVAGPYCQKPKLTTGAGDNFNAGFVYGYVNGFAPDMCLLLGTASSGFYVRKARSGDSKEIQAFLKDWDAGRLD